MGVTGVSFLLRWLRGCLTTEGKISRKLKKAVLACAGWCGGKALWLLSMVAEPAC